MNTRFLRIITIIAAATIILTGCVSFSGVDLFRTTVRGSGNAAQEERTVSGFDEVSLNGIGYLEITTGDSNRLLIEADDNILPHLTTEVRSGRLIIGTEQGFNIRPDVPIRYSLTIASDGLERLELNGSGEIYAPELSQPELTLEINGSGDIDIDQLDGDRIITRLDGSGNINLTGQVAAQDVDINGSGNYDAGNLQTDETTVSVDGSGDVIVWSEELLDIRIGGSGSVSYYGSPDLNQRSTGSGEIRNLGDR